MLHLVRHPALPVSRPAFPHLHRPGFWLCATARLLAGFSGNPSSAVAAGGEEAGTRPDQGVYHLFNPTPRERMREFTHDRPDVNDSPQTVDAGHFQCEMDLVALTYDRHNSQRADRRVTIWEVAPLFLKLGVLNWADLQLGLQPYLESVTVTRDRGPVGRRSSHGFGDLTPRVKLNLWGNDGGETAFALIPFLKVPTAADGLGNGRWEGGINLPFETALPWGFEAGVMPILSVLANDSGRGRHGQYGGAFVIGHPIAGPLEGLVEFIGLEDARRGASWEGVLNLALTWKVARNFHLDAGVRLGLTRAADDIRPYAGMSWRY